MDVSEPQVNHCPQVEPTDDEARPFRELMEDTGLLWLINRMVFHPRGFALALVFADEDRQNPVGWQLVGDGTQVWTYDPAEAVTEAERFAAATRTFDEPRFRAALAEERGMQEAIDELVGLGLVEVVDDDPDEPTVGR